MGKGAQRRKKGGQRPGGRAKHKRLDFLCDHNIPTQLIKTVGEVAGYTTVRLQDLGLQQSLDRGAVKDAANERKAVILTQDSDYRDPVDFRICTHPGVLWIHMTSQRSTHVGPRLKAFLQSRDFVRCKHALVELRDSVAIVTTAKGVQPEIRYYDQ